MNKIRYVFNPFLKEITLFDKYEDKFVNKKMIRLPQTKDYILNILEVIKEYRILKISLLFDGEKHEGYMPFAMDDITISLDEDLLDGRFNKC